MTNKTIVSEEARNYIGRIAPKLGCDFTYAPSFPEGRKDVCVVSQAAEDGSTYGFDTLYLVWKTKDGKIQHREIANSRGTKEYIGIRSIKVDGDQVTVEYGGSGVYSGSPWSGSRTASIGD